MRQRDARTHLELLDRDECLILLNGRHVGRLAVVHGGAPMIYPVNFSVAGDQITFRSDPGTKIEAALRSPVCFEVDHLDEASRCGWSVVVTGRLETAPDAPPVDSWAGDLQRAFRLVPDRITGRSVGPST
jgi:nitroimidazol reductase NimA-like FMN-containing flavoprotein (pyridoxamine 5'-phosphate oxidase superfamily)